LCDLKILDLEREFVCYPTVWEAFLFSRSAKILNLARIVQTVGVALRCERVLIIYSIYSLKLSQNCGGP
jgi:hypothetical protein